MKISEKQIFSLMAIANSFIMCNGLSDAWDQHKDNIATLLEEINGQQSEEIKEVS